MRDCVQPGVPAGGAGGVSGGGRGGLPGGAGAEVYQGPAPGLSPGRQGGEPESFLNSILIFILIIIFPRCARKGPSTGSRGVAW